MFHERVWDYEFILTAYDTQSLKTNRNKQYKINFISFFFWVLYFFLYDITNNFQKTLDNRQLDILSAYV